MSKVQEYFIPGNSYKYNGLAGTRPYIGKILPHIVGHKEFVRIIVTDTAGEILISLGEVIHLGEEAIPNFIKVEVEEAKTCGCNKGWVELFTSRKPCETCNPLGI